MENCDRFTQSELVYQSSEQYLILCLKICNLIIKNKCHIESLLELASSSNSTSSIGHKKPASSSSTTTIFDLDEPTNLSSLYTPAQLLSHLNETECAKYAHKESYKLSLFICGILLCLLILVLNSLTLITIVKTRRLHSITNILIANLSASDFLSGVAFLYPCILNLLTINALESYDSYLYTLACNIRQYYYLCLAGYSPMITSMLSSMLTLTLLAFEKYMAILHPYLYERIVNERRYVCYLSILVTWTVSILVSALPIMGWNEHNKYSSYRGFNCIHAQSMPCMFERIFTLDYILLFTGICCVCALTMLGIYGRIYMIARKHSKQIAKIHSILIQQQQHPPTAAHVSKSVGDELGRMSSTPTGLEQDFYEMGKLEKKPSSIKKLCLIKRSNSLDSRMSKLVVNKKQTFDSHLVDSNADLNEFAAAIQQERREEQNANCNFDLISEKSIRSTMSSLDKYTGTKSSSSKSRTITAIKHFRIKLVGVKGSAKRRRRRQKSVSSALKEANSTNLGPSENGPRNVATTTITEDELTTNGENTTMMQPEAQPAPSTTKYQHNNSAMSVVTNGGNGGAGGDHSSSSTSRSLSMNMKAMKTLLILLLGFYLCWVPLIGYFLTFASKKYNNLTIYILMFVACCNAVIDPLVYAFRNREFYKALLFNFNYFNSTTNFAAATTTAPTTAVQTTTTNHNQRSPSSTNNYITASHNVNNNCQNN